MPRYRIDLAWDGTAYCGWQRQPNCISIQQVVESALQHIFPLETIKVQAAGRTDAGVHALHQIAAFSVDNEREPSIILRGLNGHLSNDIVCTDVSRVSEDFLPRAHSKSKMYRYRIRRVPIDSPFDHRYAWHFWAPLDLDRMRECANLFVGTHDFQAFRAQGCSAKSTVRSIVSSRIIEVDDELHFEIEGKGFLRHMVRILMGALIGVGKGELSIQDIHSALNGGERKALGVTAPAHGLCLVWTSLLDSPSETR